MQSTATDEEIGSLIASARPMSIAMLRWADGRHQEGADVIEQQHQGRMVGMHRDRVISVLTPIESDGPCGVALFEATPDEVREIMRDDPCVVAGMMTVEVHPCLAFPEDRIPPVSKGR